MDQLHTNAENQLVNSLKAIQELAVGMFLPKFGGEWLLVVGNDNGNLTCYSIGILFGLQTLNIHQSEGTYREFYRMGASYKKITLSELMKDPFKLSEWWKENCK